MDRFSKILISATIILTFISVAALFHKTVVTEDFVIMQIEEETDEELSEIPDDTEVSNTNEHGT